MAIRFFICRAYVVSKAQIELLIRTASIKEFNNGIKLQGLFRDEFEKYGITKSELKRLVNFGLLKMGEAQLKTGNKIFYYLAKP